MIRKRVISLDLSWLSYTEALEQIIQRARERTPSYACFANVHMVIEAHKSAQFRELVNQATFTFADGMPLVKSLSWLYGIRQDRVAGMDFMEDIMATTDGLRIFFFGSSPQVLAELVAKIRLRYPGTSVVGSISPPFRPLTEDENKEYARQINQTGAHLVFVGLGCPKQETWMALNYRQINAVLLGVGGAFEVSAGLTKRAPKWMHKVSLEWFFRLMQEPGRLWRRYLLTNSLFIWLLFRQLVGQRS